MRYLCTVEPSPGWCWRHWIRFRSARTHNNTHGNFLQSLIVIVSFFFADQLIHLLTIFNILGKLAFFICSSSARDFRKLTLYRRIFITRCEKRIFLLFSSFKYFLLFHARTVYIFELNVSQEPKLYSSAPCVKVSVDAENPLANL